MKSSARGPFARGLRIALGFAAASVCAFGESGLPVATSEPAAPPPAPPILIRQSAGLDVSASAIPATQYSIGNPTDEEQFYLEMINRARASPTAEGQIFLDTTDPDVLSAYEFFGVNLALMAADFALIPPAPPLSMNANLTVAARRHSQDMFENTFQEHEGTDGSTLGQRATAAGYNWSGLGENIFAFAESVFHGHAGFEVDWGGSAARGGMQSPPGHRNSIHSTNFREIGIGVVLGTKTGTRTVGPQVVTQDFGSRFGLKPFITGVAYYDFNGNGEYDLGEGVGGIRATATGVSSFAVTANSGGYSFSVPSDGTYTVRFSAPGLSDVQRTVTVAGGANVKLDYTPVYTPPVISGPSPAGLNQDNNFTFSAVGAATAYQWKQNRTIAFTRIEGAETTPTSFTENTSGTYSVVVTDVKASGSKSFHLAHPSPAQDQFLTMNNVLRPRAGATLDFKSRLGVSTAGQVARAQVSADGGRTWGDVWSQAGDGSNGSSTFTQQQVSLDGFVDQEIRVRFVYDHTGGSFFPQTSSGVGLYLDDIRFTAVDEVVGEVVADVPSGTSFVFRPTTSGTYFLSVRPRVVDRVLAWGPSKAVLADAVQLPMVLRVSSIQRISAAQVQIEFDVTNIRAGTVFQLMTKGALGDNWSADNSAALQTVVAGLRSRFVTSTVGTPRFFRVSAQ